jgi:hypothetical protein
MEATQTPVEANPRSPAAKRMHLHRLRRRSGLRCLTVELRVTEIDALIRKGLLTSDTRNDPRAIVEALYEHLDRTLGAS